MGTWGPGVFDNDMAADVAGVFNECLAEGLSVPKAMARVFDELGELFEDYDEGPNGYLAIAALQNSHGLVEPEILSKALSILANGTAMQDWQESDCCAERQQALDDLRSKLLANETRR